MLAAARLVFIECGFEGATLDDVIARSGGSRATLYAQFGDKEGLFAAIIADLCRDILASLSQAVVAGDPEAVLSAYGLAYMKVLMTPSGLALYRMVIGEGARFPKLAARVFASGPAPTADRLADYLRAETARGRLSVDAADLAACQFLEMAKGDLHTRALFGVGRRPTATEIETCVRAAARTFCNGARPGRR